MFDPATTGSGASVFEMLSTGGGTGFREIAPIEYALGAPIVQLIVTEAAPACVLPAPRALLALPPVKLFQRSVWLAPAARLATSPFVTTVSITTSPTALVTASEIGLVLPVVEVKAPYGVVWSTLEKEEAPPTT